MAFAAALALPAGAHPLPATPVAQARVFADCAGRFSALAAHQYHFDGRAAEDTEALRDTFVALLEAVLPDAIDDGLPPPQALNWRVTAKAHQAVLLHRASFHTDPLVAEPSARIARAEEQSCRALLLGA